jgi:adenylate kinase
MKIKKHEVKNIIVTGKSGAGKQPRIDVVAEELGLKQLATGTIFREFLTAFKNGEKNREADLGKQAHAYISAGKFVPDSLTNEIFAEYFKQHDYKGCILDGYPRTVDQAKHLMKLLKKNGSHIDMIIEVHRDDENIINHTIHRRTCKSCAKVYHMLDNPPKKDNSCHDCGGEVFHRPDDTEEKLKSRLNEFHKKVVPALEELKKKDIHFVVVDGFINPYSKEKMKQMVRDALKTKIDL